MSTGTYTFYHADGTTTSVVSNSSSIETFFEDVRSFGMGLDLNALGGRYL
jgi:hypothetical protein